MSMPMPNRLIVSTPVARLFVPCARSARRSSHPIATLREMLAGAAPTARRVGSIRVRPLGLALPVYRGMLDGSAHDIVVRRRGPGAAQVVGVVPVAPFAGARSESADDITETEATEMAFELLGAETEEELDQFLGKFIKKVAKVGKGLAASVQKVGKAVGGAVNVINKFIPVKSIMSLTPIGLAARGLDSARQILRGKNIFKVARDFAQAGVKDVGNVLSLASTVAGFVPGVGTGVAAALGAAGALAQGRPITEALIAAARGAVPGGAIAQAAFDVASNMVQGKSLSEAALNAARNQLPGGPAAKAAFDTAVALAQGQKLQDVALSAARSQLPRGGATGAMVDAGLALGRGERPAAVARNTAARVLPGAGAALAFAP